MAFYDTLLLSSIIPATIFFVLFSVIQSFTKEKILFKEKLPGIVFMMTLDFIALSGISLVLVLVTDYFQIEQADNMLISTILTAFFLIGLGGISYIVYALLKPMKR
ncbi:MAG: hypothetical protein QXP36_04395 [Conexivisphaerales archaeon]